MKPLILAALAVPAVVTTVQSAHHAGHGGMMAHVHAMIEQRLELTPEQKEAAHRVFQAHHPALRAKADAALQSRADAIQAVTDPQTTEGQLRELEAKASAATLALELEANQVIREINPMLTEAQRVKFKQMVKDARAHVEGFHAMLHGEKAPS